MTDHVEHHPQPPVDPAYVVALVDQALVNAGFPAYSALAENLRRWHETVGARIEAMALGTAIAETRRLRMAHGFLSEAIGRAATAFALGNTHEGMRLLEDARQFADQHEALETRLPLPANVTHLAAHRLVRVGADLTKAGA